MIADEFDLLIVGDGVASRAAQITLAGAGLRLAIVAPEPSVVKGPGIRVGEHLSAPGGEELEHLNLLSDFLRQSHHLQSHAAFSAWGSSELIERNASFEPRGAGWSLDRQQFDDWLGRTARECVQATVRKDRVIGSEFTAAGGSVYLRSGRELQARHILDASGRVAAATRRHSGRVRKDRLISLYALLEQQDLGIEPTPGILTEAWSDGWFYSALLPGRRLIVAWFTDADLLNGSAAGLYSQLWGQRVAESQYTRRRIETAGFSTAALAGPVRIADASTRIADRISDQNWMALGDAAAAFDPLSSHGITTALWSGRKAATAARCALAGDSTYVMEYAASYAQGIARFLADRRKIYAREIRFAGEEFWRRRQATLEA